MSKARINKCGDGELDVLLCEMGSRLLILSFNQDVTFKEGQDMEILLFRRKYVITWINYTTREVIQEVVKSTEHKSKVLREFVCKKIPGGQCPVTEIEILNYLYEKNIGVVIRNV